ncbi:coiled-coil and C2 domain-containing protein 2A [Drosophila novamexicana]|uniref:coiled-coil and C2 domain-containing protein 2A n=1 Tax=Drosophila novamexicana TaxID=47314 RepID=UPI0011E6049D|nr:coiled-coil and C2 domain-containing protein 2A [Drosophila novamexicana]
MERESDSVKSKRSKKKHKTQTTRSYRKTEREVQILLSQCGKVFGRQDSQESEARSLQFFHYSEANESVAISNRNKQRIDDAASPSNLAANFIQIELSEPPIVSPQLHRQLHRYDDSFLYTPSDRLHLPLQFIDGGSHLKRYQIRMLNRYLEEAKVNGSAGKLSAGLIAQLTDSDSCRFIIDATLYRSNCPRQFKGVFLAPVPFAQFQGLPTSRCLKLCLKQLRFSAHPQFLEEHRLAQQLEDLYDLYMHNVKNKICKKLREELQIARNVAARLLDSSSHQQPQEQSSQLAAHIQRQLQLTQQLRVRYYAESTAQRVLLQRLLTQWAKLKELRKQQQFQCTRFRLSLRLVPPADLDASCSAWKERFEADLAEVYREHLEVYYHRRHIWSSEQSSVSHTKPPRKPQFAEIMESLKTKYERAFQDPEEPRVYLLRLPTDESTLHSRPSNEQLNLDRNYYLKLYLDGQFVAQTRSYRLEPDLHVDMNESLGVLLNRSHPEQLNIWLYEKSTITSHSRRLALISTPLKVTERGKTEQKLAFQVAATSAAVRPKLAGDLFLHIDYYCPDGAISSDLDDIQKLPETVGQTLRAGRLPSAATASEMRATPRSPSDAGHINAGPLIFAEQQLQLCGVEELLQNRRFQLLHSRHQQRNFHTKQLSFVPALEHEIVELEELEPHANVAQVLDPGTVWNPIDLHKHRGRKFLHLLYETITSQCVQRAKLLQTPLPLLQLLGDGLEQSTGWSALWRALCSLLFGQPAALPREPTWQPQPTCASDVVQQFNISLHVVRATGVPVRSRHILNVEQQARRSSSTGTSSDLSASLFVTQTLMYSNVRPFITLSYGQRLCRSRTAEGSNPTWNEQLQLQLTGQPNDLHEDLKISLFDEMVEQQYTDEAADIYQRVQCNWLGEYRVPMSSLLASRKFEGCIELSMPKVLVGYKRPLIESVTNISVEQYPEFKESVHLWFYLSIEPGCQVTPLQIGGLACAELPELQQFVRERRLELQQLLPHPQRYVEPLVCTSHGKRVCLTRLLEPVPLPNETQLERICRFVSLLSPVRSQLDACQNFQGVWLDNQTLLDSTWCSAKDLGVLLCNYMLSLGLECWLVLGLACPYGECTFVIYRQPESGDLLLVAPTTGKRYQLQDIFCPLTRVYSIVAAKNIYINIQAEERVSMTNFNVQDVDCWLPLFNKRQEAPQCGIHKLDYVYKRSYDLSQLQKHIERKIMKKISAWRTTRKTFWNRAFQPQLLRILSELENLSTSAGSRYDEPAYSEELEREYPNCRLYGFTMNFAYTNLAAISERIRTTCIHYNNNADVEFCVAVHINAYVNDVLSVWVFLLSIVPLVG